jgi:lipoprotein-anchoring transpeptidase ErfK/SrfK
MTKSISFDWISGLKLLILGGTLSVSVVGASSNQVWAQSKSKLIKQTVKTLQTSQRRWIQVDLSEQRLTAWEGKTPVYAVRVSSGKKASPTLTGVFNIRTKLKQTRMRGEGYDMPNVPSAMFYDGNYGIHGAYWHKRFGTPVSRGCVNVAPNHAKWLFDWASVGTPVVIQR